MFNLKQVMKARVEEATGASIVIALAFFLVCALIGSIVLTTATVNSRTTADYKESHQSEYTVSSAAQLVSRQLQNDTSIAWDWAGASPTNKPSISVFAPNSSFAFQLWNEYGDRLWEYDSLLSTWQLTGFEISGVEVSGVGGIDPVFATIEVDRDLNIKVYFSLDNAMSELSLYNEVVELQSITSYNNVGQLISVSWESPLITKSDTGTSA